MKYTRYAQSTSGGMNFLIIVIVISEISISSLFMYLIILLIHFISNSLYFYFFKKCIFLIFFLDSALRTPHSAFSEQPPRKSMVGTQSLQNTLI